MSAAIGVRLPGTARIPCYEPLTQPLISDPQILTSLFRTTASDISGVTWHSRSAYTYFKSGSTGSGCDAGHSLFPARVVFKIDREVGIVIVRPFGNAVNKVATLKVTDSDT